MTKFQKRIYVQEEGDGSDSYLLAHKLPQDAEDGEIAIYELVQVGKKITRTELEFKNNKQK
jgi:hypothetical protein